MECIPNEILDHIFSFIHNDLINIKLTCVLWNSLITRNNQIIFNSSSDIDKELSNKICHIQKICTKKSRLIYFMSNIKYISKYNSFICIHYVFNNRKLLLMDIYWNVIKEIECKHKIFNFDYDNDTFYTLTGDILPTDIYKYENDKFVEFFTNNNLIYNFHIIGQYIIINFENENTLYIYKNNVIINKINYDDYIVINNNIVSVKKYHLKLHNIYDGLDKCINIKKYISEYKDNKIKFIDFVNQKRQFYLGNTKYIILFDF